MNEYEGVCKDEDEKKSTLTVIWNKTKDSMCREGHWTICLASLMVRSKRIGTCSYRKGRVIHFEVLILTLKTSMAFGVIVQGWSPPFKFKMVTTFTDIIWHGSSTHYSAKPFKWLLWLWVTHPQYSEYTTSVSYSWSSGWSGVFQCIGHVYLSRWAILR